MSLRFIKTALLTQCKLNLVLKLSFLLKLLAVVLKHGLFLLTWMFFFNRYVNIVGWGFSEMLAMYGFFSFGVGVVEMFFYGLRDLPHMVDTNLLDNYLTQPRSVLLNVALAKGDIVAFSEIINGLLLLGISNYLKSDLFFLFFLLPLSALFIFSLHLYLSSISFFVKNSREFVRELYRNATIIAGQPNSAYKGALKILTLTLIPTAYLSFFPIEFLRTHNNLLFLCAYLGTFVFFGFAWWFFYLGLSRYESSSVFSNKY